MLSIKKVGVAAFVMILLVAMAIIVASPLITIWAVNTLFGLGVEYTFWTWLAMSWIYVLMFGGRFKTIDGDRK